ncbi:MAG: hypothetical protein K2X86_04790 [Cytophagaceae bacterium]|nr:hypothetical protein [Cytophagaceae bacterium]
MDIKKALLKEHSKAQTVKITKYIGDDKDRFDELMKLLLKGEYRITQRASWVAYYCIQVYPELIKPHWKELIFNLKKSVHDAVKRNTLGILQNVVVPEKYWGELADICFKFLNSSGEPIAVRVLAMSVLYNITLREPALMAELRTIIEDRMPYESPAFTSRGNKILKLMKKFQFKPKTVGV